MCWSTARKTRSISSTRPWQVWQEDLGAQVRNVREVDVGRSGHPVDAPPLRLGLLVGVPEDLLHLGALRLDGAVTEGALLRARDEHVGGLAPAVLVTELALDLALAGVNPVAVVDRLRWRRRSAPDAGDGRVDRGGHRGKRDEEGNDELGPAHG